MASTFFGLNIAYTGIMAANAKINTTANNISNVETKGYSRQEANQIAADALRISTSYGMAGSGVETTDIRQVRNFFYDVKYWQCQSNLGQYEIKHQYTTQIEDYFATVTKDQIEGFEPIFTNLFAALEAVKDNSGDDSKKTQFIGQAGDLCRYFNAQATNLEKLQLDVNSEIKIRTDSINSIAEQIATLNKQINTIEVNKGSYANELRDRRALLVDELSKIVDVEIRETPIYTFEGGDTKSGLNKYEVLIAGGQKLVNGYDYYTLECVARDYKVNQSDAEGLYDIRWSNGLDFNLYGANLGGELKGLIEVRDGNNEEYFHGKTTVNATNVVQDGTDPYKYTITVTLPYPAPSYMADMNKNKLPQTGEINFGNTLYDYDDWEYVPEVKGDPTATPPIDPVPATYTFTVKTEPGERQPDTYTGDVDVSIGRPVDYQGIAYYQAQLNEWTRIFARAMNDIEKQTVDAYEDHSEVLFTNKDITGTHGKDYTFDDVYYPDGTPIPKSSYKSGDDDYFNLTAGRFNVNRNMEVDVNRFGTTYDPHKGADTQDMVKDMLKIQHDKNKVSFRGCSAQEFLQVITADISLGKSNARTFEENYTNISRSVDNQRMSVSAVDNDEEALNLVKFKEAYNLSAKVMQVMTEIYNRLILETGV